MSRSPFLNQISERMVTLRYAKRTIETYLYWIKLYILHHSKKHPSELGDEHIEAFLSHLANQRNVSISTQKTALNALVFLYTKIMDKTVNLKLDFNRAVAPRKLPVVLTPQEIKYLLDALSPPYLLPAQLLYGSGLRLMECMRLRVQDIDFNYSVLRIWNAKGGKHRQVTLAPELFPSLQQQIGVTNSYFNADVTNPLFSGVWLPHALSRRYPNAPKEFGWQYLFCASNLAVDPESGTSRRHYFYESGLQKAICTTALQCKLSKPIKLPNLTPPTPICLNQNP